MIDIVNSVVKDTPHFITPSNDAFITNLGNFVKTVDANNLAASQQYSKIEQMLAQMDVNDGDKHIIEETKQQLNDKVNEYSTMLGNGTSINALIRFEGDMLVNPELKQAVINQQKWRNEEAALRARQDLPENMKEWWINKYKYTGIKENDYVRDENGNITAIKEWNEPFKLAEHVQDITILEQVKARLNYDSYANGETTSQYDIDENGKLVVTSTNTSSKERQYINQEKVWNAVVSTVMGDVKNRLSYYQEYLYDMNKDVDNTDINSVDALKNTNINLVSAFNRNDGSLGLDFQTWLYRKFLGNTNAIAYERYKEISSEQDKITKLGTNSGSGGDTQSTSTVSDVRTGSAGVVTSDNAMKVQSHDSEYPENQADYMEEQIAQHKQTTDSITTINR